MNIMDRFRDVLPIKEPDAADYRRFVYRRAPQIVWVSQRGTTILFDVDRGAYESLNDVATTVWQLLVQHTEGTTFDSMLNAVQAEYDLPPEVPLSQVERDICALLSRLERSRAIVREHHT